MRRNEAACLIVCVGMSLAGCGRTVQNDPGPQMAVRRMDTATVSRDDRATRGFRPARDAVTSGGFCTQFALPRAGVRRLSVTFPSREAPETAISLVIDSSNTVLRYVETRGLAPRSTDRTIPAEARLDSIVQTAVQLDYVTGEAFLYNRGPGQDGRPVMSSVMGVEKTGVVGDIAARQKAALAVCTRTGR